MHLTIYMIVRVCLFLGNITSSVNVVVLVDALEWPWSNQTFAIVFINSFFILFLSITNSWQLHMYLCVFFSSFFSLSHVHDHYQSAGKKKKRALREGSYHHLFFAVCSCGRNAYLNYSISYLNTNIIRHKNYM